MLTSYDGGQKRRTVATAECHAEANVCQCQYLQDLSNIQDCVEDNDPTEMLFDALEITNSRDLVFFPTAGFQAVRAKTYSIEVAASNVEFSANFLGNEGDRLDVIESVRIQGVGEGEKVVNINNEAFDGGLTNMTRLDVVKIGLDSASFHVPPGVKILKFSGNALTTFDFDALASTAPDVDDLDLSDNAISTIEADYGNREVLGRLTSLDLKSQRDDSLTSWPSDLKISDAFPMLRWIDLSGNALAQLPNFGESDVEEVSLPRNKVTHVSGLRPFVNMRFMNRVDLADNDISLVGSSAFYINGEFDSVRGAVSIDLRRNRQDILWASDAFGAPAARTDIGEIDLTSSEVTSLPRVPFLELLSTSYDRAEVDSDWTKLTVVRTNNTQLDCCSLYWLFSEGLLKGSRFKDQVPFIQCSFSDGETAMKDLWSPDISCESFGFCSDADEDWEIECEERENANMVVVGDGDGAGGGVGALEASLTTLAFGVLTATVLKRRAVLRI